MTPDVITDCRTRQVAVKAVRYGGTSPAAVDDLICACPGVIAFIDDGGRLIIREDGEEDRVVQPGWCVTRLGDEVTVHAGPAFSRFFLAD